MQQHETLTRLRAAEVELARAERARAEHLADEDRREAGFLRKSERPITVIGLPKRKEER